MLEGNYGLADKTPFLKRAGFFIADKEVEGILYRSGGGE